MSDDEMVTLADQSSESGRRLAADIVMVARQNGLDTPAVITACAYVFAACLVNADGHLTIHEAAGLGLIGDDERIAQHCELIRELITAMRAQRKTSGAPLPQGVQ